MLPAAVDRELWLAAAAAGRRRLTMISDDLGEEATLDLDGLAPPLPERSDRKHSDREASGWWDCPAGVAWVLQEQGRRLVGVDLAVASDIPIGAGISSSAALEMALLLAVEQLSGFHLDQRDRAAIGRSAENRYLGVQSGIMDQYACLAGKRDHLILLDCRSVEHQLLPLPAGTGILVADTGVRRRLADCDYSDRREQCRQAVALLRRFLPEIRTLRDVSEEQLERHLQHLPPPLDRRARHTVEECARVLAGAAALRHQDLQALGRLMVQSHCSSRDLYETSIPELDELVAAATAAPGCYGARLAGGGFGGCVVAMAEQPALSDLGEAMSEAFVRRFGRRPELLPCCTADGAELIMIT